MSGKICYPKEESEDCSSFFLWRQILMSPFLCSPENRQSCCCCCRARRKRRRRRIPNPSSPYFKLTHPTDGRASEHRVSQPCIGSDWLMGQRGIPMEVDQVWASHPWDITRLPACPTIECIQLAYLLMVENKSFGTPGMVRATMQAGYVPPWDMQGVRSCLREGMLVPDRPPSSGPLRRPTIPCMPILSLTVKRSRFRMQQQTSLHTRVQG